MQVAKQDALREESVGNYLRRNHELVISPIRIFTDCALTYFSKLLKSR
jgi:hypothetical protein